MEKIAEVKVKFSKLPSGTIACANIYMKDYWKYRLVVTWTICSR